VRSPPQTRASIKDERKSANPGSLVVIHGGWQAERRNACMVILVGFWVKVGMKDASYLEHGRKKSYDECSGVGDVTEVF
jgi:hypothetical protein